MSIFERVIPFPERVRWMMLKAAIDTGTKASTIAARLEWPLHRVRKMVMATKVTIRLDDLGQWFFAIDGALVKFDLVPSVATKPTTGK